MIADLEKFWEGFHPEVTNGPQPGRFIVKFRTRGGDIGAETVADLVPPTVFLETEHGGNLRVIGFTGGPNPSPGLGQGDYEQRAVDEVRNAIAAGLV